MLLIGKFPLQFPQLISNKIWSHMWYGTSLTRHFNSHTLTTYFSKKNIKKKCKTWNIKTKKKDNEKLWKRKKMYCITIILVWVLSMRMLIDQNMSHVTFCLTRFVQTGFMLSFISKTWVHRHHHVWTVTRNL